MPGFDWQTAGEELGISRGKRGWEWREAMVVVVVVAAAITAQKCCLEGLPKVPTTS